MNIVSKNVYLAILAIFLINQSQAWAENSCQQLKNDKTFGNAGFVNNCINCKYNSGKLSADCKVSGGSYTPSSLVIGSCQYGVKTSNGKLVCEGLKIQLGSFLRSCTAETKDSVKITANCTTSSSEKDNKTSIDLNKCAVGDLVNRDGILTCENLNGTSYSPIPIKIQVGLNT